MGVHAAIVNQVVACAVPGIIHTARKAGKASHRTALSLGKPCPGPGAFPEGACRILYLPCARNRCTSLRCSLFCAEQPSMLWLPDESWRRTIVAWGCLLTLPLLVPSSLGSLSLTWFRG